MSAFGSPTRQFRFCPTFLNAELGLVFVVFLGIAPRGGAALVDSNRASAEAAILATESGLPSHVRVRLDTLKESIVLSGIGLRDPGRSQRLPERLSAAFQVVRVRWRPVSAGLMHWQVVDRESGVVISEFKAKTFEVAGSGLRLNLMKVPDRLSLHPRSGGRGPVDVIATLDLEDYLRGVLPSEMPRDWPLEALKAQAVAARTYAVYQIRRRQRWGAVYHLEATVMDQVFRHPLTEDGRSESDANVERAIRETRGVILRDRAGRPIQSFFHADCGGKTEDAREVWGAEGQGTATDQTCPVHRSSQWTALYSLQELSERLRGLRPSNPRAPERTPTEVGTASGPLARIEIGSRTQSGRVAKMRLVWSDGLRQTLSGHEFRMAVGFNRIKSTKFTLLPREDRKGVEFVEFVGQGHGHGVGLCQWGARHWANAGRDYRFILKHYYPKALIGPSLASSWSQDPLAASLSSPGKP